MSNPKGFSIVKNKWRPLVGDIVICTAGAEYVVTTSLGATCDCICIKPAQGRTKGASYVIDVRVLAPVPPTEESAAYSQGQFVKMVCPPYAVGVVVYRVGGRALDVLFADGMKQIAAKAVVPFHGTLSVGGDSND